MANAYVHSQISMNKRGGSIEDYYPIHDFCDCSKEVESSNRHRVYFHTMWGVKNVVIPLFGHTLINSENKLINTKDLCEQDHILPDYSGKFIPSLNDFIDCVEDNLVDDAILIEQFHAENRSFLKANESITNLLLSPLWNTGKIKSLLLTHNSWFLGHIVPMLFKDIEIEIKEFNLSPSVLFNRMEWRDWMNNGAGAPPSFAKLAERRKSKVVMTFDKD